MSSRFLLTRAARVTATLAVYGAALLPLAAQQPRSAAPATPDDRAIVHVLNRIGFGPARGDVERVRRVGIAPYIEQQLHPERLADAAVAARLARFETLGKSTRELAAAYFLPAMMERQQRQQAGAAAADPVRRGAPRGQVSEAARRQRQVFVELAEQKVLRAAYSERQLEEVMVDFWFNHFNVFAGKGQTRVYLTEYERDAIRPHVFGQFRDLLGATATSPAMLFYLDNWQSAAAEGRALADRPAARGRGGIPRPDARPGVRPGARRVLPQPPRAIADRPAQNRRPRGLNENYARELMELHTLGVDGGYTQNDVQEVARAFTGWTIANPRMGGGFRFEPRMHDAGEKIVLGQRIPAGGGVEDGEQVLDILARHPSTARFIATKLARRFVADEPSAALVARAAGRFQQTDGNIREVVRTIVTSPEFFAPAAYRAKVKTPFEFVASAVRATGTDLVTAAPVVQALRELGMPLYMCQPPTGYADRAEAWVNTGALLSRMNFAVNLTAARPRAGGRMPAFAGKTPAAASAELVRSALAGDLSEATASTVAKAESASQAIALVLGSPEFQKR
jgi:uncharacterized protein (DUF1800 family)